MSVNELASQDSFLLFSGFANSVHIPRDQRGSLNDPSQLNMLYDHYKKEYERLQLPLFYKLHSKEAWYVFIFSSIKFVMIKA